MGESADTPTRLLDRFEERHRKLRAELRPIEQHVFDELLNAARQRSNALNRYPEMDYERVVTLAMVLSMGADLHRMRERLAALETAFTEAGLRQVPV